MKNTEQLQEELFKFMIDYYLWLTKTTPFVKYHDDKSGLSKRLKKLKSLNQNK